MPIYSQAIQNTTTFLKEIAGYETGTRLFPITPIANVAIDTGVPSPTMPQALYRFPAGQASITFPIEDYSTPAFEGAEFDHKNPDHLDYIAECNQAFTEELQKLKNLDRCLEASIALWLGVKVIQVFLKDRPFAGMSVKTVALQSFAMNAFSLTDEAILINALFILLKQRQMCFKSYHNALQRMMHNMAWSCGYQTTADDASVLAATPVLMQMVLKSAEVLTLKEIQDIIADPIEQTFLIQAQTQQTGAGYSERRHQNTLALYGTKATNPYYFAMAPVAWAGDLVMQSVTPIARQLGLFETRAAQTPRNQNNTQKVTEIVLDETTSQLSNIGLVNRFNR